MVEEGYEPGRRRCVIATTLGAFAGRDAAPRPRCEARHTTSPCKTSRMYGEDDGRREDAGGARTDERARREIRPVGRSLGLGFVGRSLRGCVAYLHATSVWAPRGLPGISVPSAISRQFSCAERYAPAMSWIQRKDSRVSRPIHSSRAMADFEIGQTGS